MPSRLRNYSTIPTGEYFIKVILQNGQESLHFGQCKGTPGCKMFGPGPEIDKVSRNLASFRRANNLPRSSYGEALDDVSVYTCQRLGGNSAWCVDSDAPSSVPGAAPGGSPCATCGNELSNA